MSWLKAHLNGRLVPLFVGLLWAASMAAEDGPFKPNVRYSTFTGQGIEIHVPTAEAVRLQRFAERAVAMYTRMRADAGWIPHRTLHLVLTDDQDSHNGFSTVVPFPLVNVQLGPTKPESGLFAGDDESMRTLVHELAHHLSNDRNHGWRGALESIFGRVLPNEPLSLLVFIFSTPNHVLSPSFWHEGIAQWSETVYADPTAAWGGRGRDSLSHMVWRLDAARGLIPTADEWRLSYEHWPYGNRAYLYGLAYTRWLSGAFGDRRGLWRMVDDQGRLNTPFAFVGGSTTSVGFRHDELIPRARQDLLAEQQQSLAEIRSQPVTALPRLTEPDWRVAAPAWVADGRLVYAGDPPQGHPGLYRAQPRPGKLASDDLGVSAWLLGNVRRVTEDLIVQADAPVGGDQWNRSRVRILTSSGRVVRSWPVDRLIMPDARPVGDDYHMVAVRLDGAGAQSLVLDGVQLPTGPRPWTPAFRPGHDQLCWVETDHDGSQLILAKLDGSERRILWQVRGRILHPVWDADGSRIFCASDVSGVANGWCIPLEGQARPITNTIGGVLAVVPSPDGRQLAILDHDAQGPYLGVISLDPTTWPAQIPQVALPWPAPVARQPLGTDATGTDLPDPQSVTVEAPALAPARPYSGLSSLRPRYWTPTTMAVPEGAIGAVAVATDALLTHQVIASAGLGYHEHSPVGLVAWTYTGWNPGLGLIVKRSELGYDQQIVASDLNFYDYVETVDTVEGRIGYGLGGMARRWQVYLAAGVDRHQTVAKASDDYQGLTTGLPAPFIGTERYLEATIAYDDSMLFPTSYDREDGTSLALVARASEPRGNRVLAEASYSLSVWPSQGHQIVLAGQLGWSDGPHDLQGRFGLGGNISHGIPRGYPNTMARGRTLEGLSAAYRFPLLRPFSGLDTTPWETRQVVVETFYDAGRVGDTFDDEFAKWYRSAGAELHLEFSYWLVRFAPGVGVVRQIDGLEETAGYFSFGFRW